MNKSLLYPLGMLVLSAILYFTHQSVDNFSLQVKLGFMSKVLLVVGMISLLLFGIPNLLKKNKSKD